MSDGWIKGWIRGLLQLGFAGLLTAAAPARADDFGQAVLDEMNYARAHPAEYAQDLWNAIDLRNRSASALTAGGEDPEAVNEAIAFLRRQTPLAPLRRDAGLEAAARAHAFEQGQTGGVGHQAASGETLGQRLQRHGMWAGLTAENISYGYATPGGVVEQLIVDSGVPGRGHRRNIFDPTLSAAGVGCGPHRLYVEMCVIDFAGAIVER